MISIGKYIRNRQIKELEKIPSTSAVVKNVM